MCEIRAIAQSIRGHELKRSLVPRSHGNIKEFIDGMDAVRKSIGRQLSGIVSQGMHVWKYILGMLLNEFNIKDFQLVRYPNGLSSFFSFIFLISPYGAANSISLPSRSHAAYPVEDLPRQNESIHHFRLTVRVRHKKK